MFFNRAPIPERSFDRETFGLSCFGGSYFGGSYFGRVSKLAAAVAMTLAASSAVAQSKHNVEGTPLDTLRNSHITADVPEAKDFVKATRPDPQALGYTPLIGTDPERPKPRDAAGIKALQAELESAAAKNTARARGLVRVKRADAKKPANPQNSTKAKTAE